MTLNFEQGGLKYFKKRLTKHDLKVMYDVIGYVIGGDGTDPRTPGRDLPSVDGALTYVLRDGQTYGVPAPAAPIHCSTKEEVYALELQVWSMRPSSRISSILK